MPVPDELPKVDIGHRSLAIDAILVEVIREGLRKPLRRGARRSRPRASPAASATIDYDIGMTNFIQNGPRVPAVFMHE